MKPCCSEWKTCPLHAAAPALLEALEAVVKEGKHSIHCGDSNVGHMRGRGCTCYIAKGRAAIRAAKGDS